MKTPNAIGLTCVLALLAGCAQHIEADAHAEPDAASEESASRRGRLAEAYASWPDPLESLPRGAQQLASVCARPGDDLVRDVFCAPSPPVLTGLAELQTALGLGSAQVTGLAGAALGNFVGLSVTSHSTALTARSVSAINPRVLAIRGDISNRAAPMDLHFGVLAFTRGEQFAEIVARDRTTKELSFYLAGFRQACNSARGGCTPGDLLSDAIERDWVELTLYDERDLQNTVLDCAPCHQPSGPGTQKLLRMQELNDPWTHWFSPNSDGGRALVADYLAAKGDEPFAGMRMDQLQAADPLVLTVLILAAFPASTPSFDSRAIEDEVRASAATAGGNQPFDNSVPGSSATWNTSYVRTQQYGGIALPYHDVKVTDPVKLARMTEAYQAYRRGELERSALPDLRDVFPDEPARLAELGFTTAPGLDGASVLLQACSLCHHAQLDPALSRARFRADLVGMSRAQKDAAIARLQLPHDDPEAMPPPRMRVLSDEAIERAIDVLRR